MSVKPSLPPRKQVWNHSAAFRASAAAHATNYAKEGAAPDPRCVSYTHDRDYGVYAEYPKGREKFRGRGWCPPSHAEYDGFEAETASRWY